jgi:tetratricopeptide (TPR) repeat protein
MQPDAKLNLAIGAHRSGDLATAEIHYRAFLQDRPGHGGAHHNLGLILAQAGTPELALEHFQIACRAEPGRAQNWLSQAKALLACGRRADALAVLEEAGAMGFSGPSFDALLQTLRMPVGGDAEPSAAEIARLQQAVAADPGNADLHFQLGAALSGRGEIAAGFAHYMRRAELVHGQGAANPAPAPAHRIKHDREQRDYLARDSAGAAPAGTFHLEDGSRVAGPAVDPAHANPDLLAQWRSHRPQFVVIDDFLAPEALEKLRRYCAGSTIWRRNYAAGYIGATPEDGFASPLLAQIVEETRAAYAGIIADHPFRYLGAFKYDSTLSTGTNTHADNSAINVNFYITPDEANLDPDSGGMDIWDVAAPSLALMRLYNSDEAAARAFLERSNAKVTRIPHRANRAVIFRSSLFHKTSDCRFAEGYLNKRINVSLLFGDWSDS